MRLFTVQSPDFSRKVYFIEGHYDVKLQADNRVRWDVAARLNRKQKNAFGGKIENGIQVHSGRMVPTRKMFSGRTNAPTTGAMAKTTYSSSNRQTNTVG
jgi:hypothetical protein